MTNGLYTLSVWLHIFAATLWIGGMGFLVFVIVPELRKPGANRASMANLVHALGVRFRTLGWLALGTLLLTGSYNMTVRGIKWADVFSAEGWQNPTVRALGIKLSLFAIVLLVSGVHDFKVGPRATEVWQREPDSAAATRLRKMASHMGRINALLALAILWLAVLVVRGGLE